MGELGQVLVAGRAGLDRLPDRAVELPPSAGRELVVEPVPEESMAETQPEARSRDVGHELLADRLVQQLEQRAALQPADASEHVEVELLSEYGGERQHALA